MKSSELFRPVAAASVPSAGSVVEIEASAAERAALAERFAILSIEALRASIRLRPRAGGAIDARGRIEALVTQACVVSLEPVAASIDAPFERVFRAVAPESTRPRPAEAAVELDLEFDPDEEDEEPFEGGSFDLGEAVAEELALSLDPFPRHPDARLEVVPDHADEEEAARPGPFSGLARFRPPEPS